MTRLIDGCFQESFYLRQELIRDLPPLPLGVRLFVMEWRERHGQIPFFPGFLIPFMGFVRKGNGFTFPLVR